jgi:hypothetical protein
LDEAIGEWYDEVENSGNTEISNMKVERICDSFREIYGKRWHKVFKLIWDYWDFFMEHFCQLSQIESLVQAVNFYAQGRIDRLSCIVPEDSDYEEFWV